MATEADDRVESTFSTVAAAVNVVDERAVTAINTPNSGDEREKVQMKTY